MKKVYLIGAGPGRADLITVRGLGILREADVVIYDYLIDESLLSETKEEAELICADKLGKKRYSDGFLSAQEKINRLLVKKAKEGKQVVRLKNGDPAIFGRLSQELEALVKNKIRFEIVPGVTGASSSAAFCGIPLTDRRFSSSVVFVTGHEDPRKKKSFLDWDKIAGCGTIVLYMAVENINSVAKILIKSKKSKDTPVVCISDAGSIKQRITRGTLNNIAETVKKENITAPAVFIIGETARLDFLKKERRVLFTGLSKERFFGDGSYVHVPLISIVPAVDYADFDNHLKNIKNFDWIVFTSRYGAEYFFKRLNKVGLDCRALAGIEIAAIGDSTRAKLMDFGIKANLVPKIESSSGLIEEFKKNDMRYKRVFLPRADIADKGLGDVLSKMGAEVVSSVAYRNIFPSDLPDLDIKSFDEIMFTSPSTVRNFKKRYGNPPRNVKISWIGDVTKKEVQRCRL